MRAALALAALVALGALVLSSPGSAQSGRSVLDVGDSLVVGTAPPLRRELSGASLQSDGRIGRPSSEAVGVLRSLYSGQRVVVFDAGTNDDPAQPGRLASNLAAARRLTGSRCLVVATLNRPPYRGVPIDGLNRAVRSFAASNANVQLVDWHAAAEANRGLIGSDGVHPTPAGYAYRAKLFAGAIGACGSSGGGAVPPPSGGLPAPGTPVPPSARRPRSPHKPGAGRPSRPSKPGKKQPPKPSLDDSAVTIDEPVTIQSRGAKLAGELLAPAGSGRHPAVVMIQGAGTAVREQYREQAEYLAEHGVGALIYDKRGSGESTGDADYRYSELAGDARAAIALLRRRPEVDPDGIGLWGLSEGGSVAPLVAAGNPQISAVMVVSPAAMAPAEQQEWAVRNGLRVSGADSGASPVTRYYAVAADLGDAGLGGDRAADFRFDAARRWRKVAQPVLAVFGGDDDIVPVRASASSLRRALAEGGANHDRTFRTFGGASHSLGVESESYRPGSAPGFKELGAAWLHAHLGGDAPVPVVSTPLPPAARHSVPVRDVQRASLLERWPVQLAWLLLPGAALVFFALRRRSALEQRDWWWLGGVVLVDALALVALAYAVASIVDVDGRGVAAVLGVPLAVVVTWLLTLGGVAATVMLARRRRGAWMTAPSVAWLALLAYWLV